MARIKRRRYKRKGASPLNEKIAIGVLLGIILIVIIGALYLAGKGGKTVPAKQPTQYLPRPEPADRSITEDDKSASTEHLPRHETAGRSIAKVTSIIDGDTLIFNNGQSVRLIGIDAPERGEPFYEEAKQFLASLLLKKEVQYELDVEAFDKYDRLLAYIFIFDEQSREIFVNQHMLSEGYAYIYTHPPNLRYVERFKDAFKQGRKSKRGLWSRDRFSMEEYYLTTPHSYLIHRPSCRYVKGREDAIRFKSLDEAFDHGLGRCRACKP